MGCVRRECDVLVWIIGAAAIWQMRHTRRGDRWEMQKLRWPQGARKWGASSEPQGAGRPGQRSVGGRAAVPGPTPRAYFALWWGWRAACPAQQVTQHAPHRRAPEKDTMKKSFIQRGKAATLARAPFSLWPVGSLRVYAVFEFKAPLGTGSGTTGDCSSLNRSSIHQSSIARQSSPPRALVNHQSSII